MDSQLPGRWGTARSGPGARRRRSCCTPSTTPSARYSPPSRNSSATPTACCHRSRSPYRCYTTPVGWRCRHRSCWSTPTTWRSARCIRRSHNSTAPRRVPVKDSVSARLGSGPRVSVCQGRSCCCKCSKAAPAIHIDCSRCTTHWRRAARRHSPSSGVKNRPRCETSLPDRTDWNTTTNLQ